MVVGTGFGARVHVPALRAAGFHVAGLVGRDPARTARRADKLGVPAIADLETALALPGVDAVSVATPTAGHAPIVLAAVAAGRHVLCEKPFARNGAEARTMLAAAEAAGVVHLVGHEFRFAPERALVGRLVASGAIGRPRLATMVSHVSLVADRAVTMPDWWFDPDQGGGWLGASGSHLVDQVLAWLGPVDEVDGRLDVVSVRDGGAEDSFSLLVRTAGGVTVVLQQTAAAWGPPVSVTRVAGDRGSVWIDGNEVWLADAGGVRAVPVPADLALPAGSEPATGPGHRFTHLELGPYTRLAEVWRGAIEGRALPTDPAPATFADGVSVMEVLDRVRAPSAGRDAPGR